MPVKNTYEVVYEVQFVRDDALRRSVKRVDWERHRMTVVSTYAGVSDAVEGRLGHSRFKIISITKVS